ncbi:MAG: DUF5681 domain-containing protein [Pseudomonadota bacterium]
MSSEYEVGYGKPPKHTRFKKGESGNPNGRPKSYKSAISVLSEPVSMQVEGKVRRVSGFEAAFRKTAQNAIEGKMVSIKRFINQLDKLNLLDEHDDFRPHGVVVIPRDYDGKKTLTDLARAQQRELRKKTRASKAEPEQVQIISKVAHERHYLPALERKVSILELVLLKLKERALKDRVDGALAFFEKLELRRMPDLNVPATGFLVVPEGTTLETTPLIVEDVEENEV